MSPTIAKPDPTIKLNIDLGRRNLVTIVFIIELVLPYDSIINRSINDRFKSSDPYKLHMIRTIIVVKNPTRLISINCLNGFFVNIIDLIDIG